MRETTKLAAAEEQLTAAIRMYFDDKDPVCVHVLARNAHEILDAICVFKKLERGVVQQGMTWIKPEERKLVINSLNETKNFFKHAREDPNPESVIQWNPEVSVQYIFDATSLHRRITNQATHPEITTFGVWYRITFPQMWEGDESDLEKLMGDARELLRGKDKKEIFELLLKAHQQASNKPKAKI